MDVPLSTSIYTVKKISSEERAAWVKLVQKISFLAMSLEKSLQENYALERYSELLDKLMVTSQALKDHFDTCAARISDNFLPAKSTVNATKSNQLWCPSNSKGIQGKERGVSSEDLKLDSSSSDLQDNGKDPFSGRSDFWGKLQAELQKVDEMHGKALKNQLLIRNTKNSPSGAMTPLKRHLLQSQSSKSGWISPEEKRCELTIEMIADLKQKAHSAKESVKIKHRWIVLPHSRLKILFDIIIGILIVYSVTTIPVQIAFGAMSSLSFQYLDIVIDTCFLLDIAVTFSTALEEGGHLIFDRWVITKRYLQTMFVPDFLGSFPFTAVVQATSHHSTNFLLMQMLRIFRVMRVLRLSALFKFVRILRLHRKLTGMDLSQTFHVDPALITLISRLSKILYLAHIMACIWYSINSCVHEVQDWTRCGEKNATSSQYLSALYFIIQTMMTTGYGDVGVNTDAQRAFAMVVQLSGPLVVGVIVSSISELVDSFDSHSKYLTARLGSLKVYMSEKKLPLQLSKKLYDHFRYLYTHTTVYQETNIMKSLPHSVHQQLILHLHQKNMADLCFFKHLIREKHSDFVLEALPLLKPMLLQAGEVITEQGNPGEEVYFIKKGQINGLMMSISPTPVLVGVYRQGSTVNLVSVVSRDEMTFTLRAACLSDVLWLGMEELTLLLKKFPGVAALVMDIVRIERRNSLSILQSNTIELGNQLVKELIICEPNEDDNQKVWPAVEVEIEPIKGVFSLEQKRTVRTLTLSSSTLMQKASSISSWNSKKIHAEDLSTFKAKEKEETVGSLWEKGLIDPESQFKRCWDLWILLLTVVSAVYIPFKLGFSIDSVKQSIMDGVVDVFYVADIILNFRTISEAAPELYFADPGIIAVRYLGTWFCLDILSAIPFDGLFYITNHYVSKKTASIRLVRITRFLRFFKLLRLFKLARNSNRVGFLGQVGAYTYILRQLALLFVVLLYVGHLFGCFWSFIAYENPSGLGNTWMGPVVVGGGGFLPNADITNQYTAAIYWAYTTITTVGYGDIKPTNDNEKAYAVAIMVVGAALFSFIVGNVSNLGHQLTTLKKLSKKKVYEINEYIKEQKLGLDLTNSIKKHMHFAFSIQISNIEHEIIEQLPCALRQHTLLHSYEKVIKVIPILQNISASFISIILQRMVPEFNEAGTFIYTPQHGSKGLYFLTHGIAEETRHITGSNANSPERYEVICMVEKGGFFGYKKFVNVCGDDMGAKAFTDCHMFVLCLDQINHLEENFHCVAHSIRESLSKHLLEKQISDALQKTKATVTGKSITYSIKRTVNRK